jgi:hypothetical protein
MAVARQKPEAAAGTGVARMGAVVEAASAAAVGVVDGGAAGGVAGGGAVVAGDGPGGGCWPFRLGGVCMLP